MLVKCYCTGLLQTESAASSELAVNDSNDEDDQYGDDGDCNYPIGSHPVDAVSNWMRMGEGRYHLLAMPLRVLMLRSVYVSDSSNLSRVPSI